MTGRLDGARLIVTRSGGPGGLVGALAAEGARVLRFPALATVPVAARRPSGEFDLAVFVSPAAAEYGLARFGAERPQRAAAVGPGTARRLRRAGIPEVVAPAAGAGIAALLATPELGPLRGRRVLLVCGRPVNRRSAAALAARGARVTAFAVYARRAARDPEPLAGWIRGGEADAIMVSSAAAVAALAALLGADAGRVAWLCSSPRVAAAVERAGARPAAVATSAADADLAAAAVRWWQSGRNRDDA